MRNILEQCLLFNLQNTIKNQSRNLPAVAHCHKKIILVHFWDFFSTIAVNVSVIPSKGGHRTAAHMFPFKNKCVCVRTRLCNRELLREE